MPSFVRITKYYFALSSTETIVIEVMLKLKFLYFTNHSVKEVSKDFLITNSFTAFAKSASTNTASLQI